MRLVRRHIGRRPGNRKKAFVHCYTLAVIRIRSLLAALVASIVALAATVPFLTVATIWHGLRDNRPKHRRLAKVTFPIWLYVSVTGVIIYWMLYRWE